MKGHLFGVLVLEGLVGLHRTIQFQLRQPYWSGHRLGLLWYWMVCLEYEQRSFCRFWDCIQVLHWTLLLTIRATPFLLRNSWSKDIMVINYIHQFYLPKISMFSISISCFTTSNLLWFVYLTLQVPMLYCSLQHRISLPSPVTSTTGCCFCFGSVSSFYLNLVLHWSPGAYWVPTDLGSLSFSVLSFFLFILFMGFSKHEYWSGLPFPSPVANVWSEICTMTRSSWLALHSMVHSFTELDKAVVHVIRLVSFLWLWLSVCPLMEIQFSVEGQVCVPSLFFDLRPIYGGGDEDNGNLLQKMPWRPCYNQCPEPCSRPPPTHASSRDSWIPMGKSWSVSCGSLLLSLGPGVH